MKRHVPIILLPKTAFETATNELNDTRLVAPFDGYVGEVYIEKFQDVKATQPVVSFIDITQLRIEAYITQDIAFQAEKIKEVASVLMFARMRISGKSSGSLQKHYAETIFLFC